MHGFIFLRADHFRKWSLTVHFRVNDQEVRVKLLEQLYDRTVCFRLRKKSMVARLRAMLLVT
jgi:hypothetical protein